MIKGIRIGSIRGIAIFLDWSLLVMFLLISLSLGAVVFPTWHPDWGSGLGWMTAFTAALLFLASLLLHELAHALVGRGLGAEIRRISLFIFGGMAELERPPSSWRGELLMAAVGPVVSLAVGFVCLTIGAALAAGTGVDLNNPEAGLAVLGPFATILLWLGPANIVLAMFNLLPGFPLDGGRILRAVLWGWFNDIYRATRWASAMGRAIGVALVAIGLAMFIGIPVPLFGRGPGGLWLALIGLFLHNAAYLSYRQLLALRSLADVQVSSLMVSDVATVDLDMPVSAFVDDYRICHEPHDVPVVQNGLLMGLVSFDQVRQVAPEVRSVRRVAEVMTPLKEVPVVAPEAAAADALDTIFRREVDQLPVVADGRMRGLLRREDILRWLALHGEGMFA